MPETPTDREKNVYFELRDDKYMQNISAYDLVASPRTNNPSRSRVVLAQGPMTYERRNGHTTGLVYDPDTSPGALNFIPQSYDELNYSEVKKRNLLQECEAFKRLGLAELIDPNTGNYQKPILQLLDQLIRETNSSGVFRAFVTLKLCALAAQRPEQWGLPWSPALAQHLKALTDLGAGDLKSGDWMVRAQIVKYEAPLLNYFARARDLQLANQAAFLQQLLRESCREGFSLAGLVDGDGRLVLRQTNAPAQDYWGWGGRPASALLLFRKSSSDNAPVKIADPLPFTPLFVFRGDPRNLLNKVAQDTSCPASRMAPFLPPLFTQP
jgi:hypothetical protein